MAAAAKPMMRTVLLSVVLVATVLAGCVADPETKSTTDSPDPTGTTSASGGGASGTGSPTTTSGAGNNTTAPDENMPPTANITSDVPNGTAPLSVNFTLSGDDEASPLNWTLDFGDGNSTNGTGLPATVQHNFTVEGNYTVVLNVTDGVYSTEANVTVSVEAPAATGAKICTVKEDQVIGGNIYQYDTTWFFLEANDIPGLQVENNHILMMIDEGLADQAGEINADWVGCENGDQLIF